jgi:hypothetical protein
MLITVEAARDPDPRLTTNQEEDDRYRKKREIMTVLRNDRKMMTATVILINQKGGNLQASLYRFAESIV